MASQPLEVRGAPDFAAVRDAVLIEGRMAVVDGDDLLAACCFASEESNSLDETCAQRVVAMRVVEEAIL